MAFCSKCGNSIYVDDKFCVNCGTPTNEYYLQRTEENIKISYDIKLKCPNCGYNIDPLMTKCPACDSVIRNSGDSESVWTFANKIEKFSGNPGHVAMLIKSFPIPNSKEDILDFMVIASTNIRNEDRKTLYDAWVTKFEQCYQKAKVLYENESFFTKVQKIYNETIKIIKKNKTTSTLKSVGKASLSAGKTTGKVAGNAVKISAISIGRVIESIFRNAVVVLAIFLYKMAIETDQKGENGSGYEFLGAIIIIVSASILKKRNAPFLDFLIVGTSGIVSIYLSRYLENGSLLYLTGLVTIIIVIVNYFRVLLKRGKNNKDNEESDS